MAASGAAKVYEDHIKALPAAQRLQLLALIADDLAVEGTGFDEAPRYSLADLAGVGKGVWKGVDAQEYVNRLREGCDDELQ
jgi:hypothetical protein